MIQDFSLDRLNNVSARRAGRAAMAAIDKLQDFTPEEQAAGVGVIFLLLQRQYGFGLTQSLAVANNLLAKASYKMPEIRAVKHYTENEI